MGTESQYMRLLETRRLIWLGAVVFAVVVMVQVFGHPYGYILPSLFSSATKGHVASRGSFDMRNSTGNSTVSGNLTWIPDLSRGKDGDDVKEFSELEVNEEADSIDPENEFPSKDFDSSNNSRVEGSGRNDSFTPGNIPALDSNNTGSENGTSPDTPSVMSLPLVPPRTNPEAPGTSPDRNVGSVGNNNSFSTPEKDRSPGTDRAVSIAEMNVMLQQSRTSFHSTKPRWSSSADTDILRVKALIEDAPLVGDAPDLYAPLYRNLSKFKRSYELMEQTLKVYVYSEGKRPIFHTPILKGIYASEGWFMRLLKSSKRFVTKNPKKAHLFYLPFSSRMLEETLYVPNSHDRKPLVKCLSDYLNTLIQRHAFWNRTDGADHFLVACHDWAPAETQRIMKNCIRALCNADAKQGFRFGKDASLPETYVKSPKKPLRELGGKSLSRRHNLAFFAGNMHGYLRPVLLRHWENKDPDMKIFGHVDSLKYVNYMKSSKYCICAKGYEVNSPRVVEALFYECVPVIISDNFVPPFFETLDWESFAVFVPEKDIPDLKNILTSIPDGRFREMQRRVKLVQRHFLWHKQPERYDAFHMILHSVWHNRVFGITTR